MKKYNIFAIQFLFSSLAAYLWQPEDSCKVSISFCIEANALTDIDNLDSTRQLLKNIYNYTSTNFNYHFVPSTAFIYGYNTTLQSFNFEQLFEYNSFFLNEGFSEALENVPIRSESEKVQTEDAQQGAKECLGRVAALSLPYGSNNMIVFVSKHFLNVTMLNDLKISTEYVSVVTKVQEPVSSFFTNVCGGKAVNTCGEPAMYFGVNRESCSGYLGGDTCMLTCPAPYSTDRRIIKCFIGTGWVIDEKCKDSFDWLTIVLITFFTLISIIPFVANVRYVIKTTRNPTSDRPRANQGPQKHSPAARFINTSHEDNFDEYLEECIINTEEKDNPQEKISRKQQSLQQSQKEEIALL